jgi:uncharacterized protein
LALRRALGYTGAKMSEAKVPPFGLVERALVALVAASRRFAWPLFLLALAGTFATGFYVARNARIDTDTSEVLSRDLPFRQANREYRQAFPALRKPLLVIVEGQNQDRVDDGADRLAAAMGRRSDLFHSVLYAPGEPFFRRNGLLYLSAERLSDLSDRLAESQPFLVTLAGDPSLRGLFDLLRRAIEEGGDELTATGGFRTGLDAVSNVIEARTSEQAETLAWSTLMGGERPAPERRRIILAEAKTDSGSLEPAAPVLRAVRELAEELGLNAGGGVNVRLSGEAALETEELHGVFSGTITASMISLLAVAFLVVVGMRSVRLVAAVMISLLIGLIWTAGAAIAVIGRLNLISVYFAVLFVGIAVDFGIHFVLRYKEQRVGGRDHNAALANAAAGVGPSLLLAGLAAIVAFLSFLPTAYIGVAELGVISAIGMVVAVTTSFTVLPALLTIMRGRRESGPTIQPGALAVESFVRTHPRTICGLALLLALACMPLLTQLRFENNPLNLQDPTSPSVIALRALMRDDPGARLAISFIARDGDGARALRQRLSGLASVHGVVSIADLVPADQERKLAIIQDMGVFLAPLVAGVDPVEPPTDDERRHSIARFLAVVGPFAAQARAGELREPLQRLAAALRRFIDGPGRSPEALADLDMALAGSLIGRIESLKEALQAGPVVQGDLPPAILRQFVAPDGRIRVEVQPREDLIDGAALRRFVAEVSAAAPGAGGPPVWLVASGDAVTDAFRTASIIALVLISVLLLIQLRSAIDTVLVLAPLALAATLTFAISATFGPALNFANIIVLPLMLGLGVSSGIYLVTRAREEANGLLLRTITPRAVLFSALTTMASFGSLAVSGHVGTASMGLLLLIAITLSLVCTLIVLPAMLTLRYRAQ